jgi:hypothetical protein
MIQATDSFGDMLTMITRGFLSGSESDLRSNSFRNAQNRYKSVFTQLTKNLKEAKKEHYVLGTEEEFKIENNLVNCMQRLAQSIGGLRSAAMTQFALLKESPEFGNQTPNNPRYQSSEPQFGLMSSPNGTRKDRFAVLTAIEEASEEGSGAEDEDNTRFPGLQRQGTATSLASISSTAMPTARTPADIFSRFILHLGPSMKSLAYSLAEILQELPFGEGPAYEIAINEHFKTSLADALYELYDSSINIG